MSCYNRYQYQKHTISIVQTQIGPGSDLTTGFMFTCPTSLVALPGFRG